MDGRTAEILVSAGRERALREIETTVAPGVDSIVIDGKLTRVEPDALPRPVVVTYAQLGELAARLEREVYNESPDTADLTLTVFVEPGLGARVWALDHFGDPTSIILCNPIPTRVGMLMARWSDKGSASGWAAYSLVEMQRLVREDLDIEGGVNEQSVETVLAPFLDSLRRSTVTAKTATTAESGPTSDTLGSVSHAEITTHGAALPARLYMRVQLVEEGPEITVGVQLRWMPAEQRVLVRASSRALWHEHAQLVAGDLRAQLDALRGKDAIAPRLIVGTPGWWGAYGEAQGFEGHGGPPPND